MQGDVLFKTVVITANLVLAHGSGKIEEAHIENEQQMQQRTFNSKVPSTSQKKHYKQLSMDIKHSNLNSAKHGLQNHKPFINSRKR